MNSTDLIEELLPKDVSISFGKGFLAGLKFDLANASYFLNSFECKKTDQHAEYSKLIGPSNIDLASAQKKDSQIE